MAATKEVELYVRSMGKMLRVTHVFDNDKDANDHMERHQESAVVACVENFVLMADKYDKGE